MYIHVRTYVHTLIAANGAVSKNAMQKMNGWVGGWGWVGGSYMHMNHMHEVIKVFMGSLHLQTDKKAELFFLSICGATMINERENLP